MNLALRLEILVGFAREFVPTYAAGASQEVLFVHDLFEVLLGKQIPVIVPNVEDGAVVPSDLSAVVIVYAGPVIKLELHIEYITVQKFPQLYALLQDLRQSFQKQEGGREVVLVVDDVLNHQVKRSNLIVLKSHPEGRPIEVVVDDLFRVLFFIADDVAFLDLVFVEERELTAKVLFELVAQKVLHGPTVKGENGDHVGAIEFQK